ncbi:hypothetical protein K435DRAFT_876706 [Dendrothele bispora CBS 962.96]|uniref:Uncharacterized protein n=1 Tax=Dendrothele bispora (strain CBS 962.96) TaxID=1314807 RepID=A0A4S8KRG8_DENBC|nr:hypothetical protein K435DRAFT_876706 [Dendrothele bispora CBS 962.96]
MSSSTNPLWEYFHRGEKQNSAQYETWCKGCVKYYLDKEQRELEERIRNEDEAKKYQEQQKAFKEACIAAGSVRGEETAFITHLLGSHRNKTQQECLHASDEAKVEAKRQREQGTSSTVHAQGKTTALKCQISALVDTPGSLSEPSSSPASKKLRQTHLKTYNALQMPFSDSEVEALQAQALRAQVSSKSPETLFEDQEMLKFIGMLRKEAIHIMPTAKVLGGRLLTAAAATVEKKLEEILRGQVLGMS